jgi:serine/threonine protein phosphatase PrpC
LSSSTARTQAPPRPHPRPYRLECFGATDTGLLRAKNQDRYSILTDAGLCVVADGMGGAAAGEIAAEMAVEFVREAFTNLRVTWPEGVAGQGATGLSLLTAAIERANHRIHEAAKQTPAWAGMGTTIAAAVLCGRHMGVAHVGDSRIYRLRERRFTLLTADHATYHDETQSLLDDPDEAEEFTLGESFFHEHLMTRVLGRKPTVQVETRLLKVESGDTYLLCTDGLSGVVRPRSLLEVLVSYRSLRRAARRLIRRARDRGGPDNITAVLVRVR